MQLTNNGLDPIDVFTISYNVEKYREGTNSAGYFIQLYYSTDGAIWTSAGSDFLTSFSADASNTGYDSAPGVTVNVSNKTLNKTIAAGTSIYLAWNYSVTSGSTTSNAQALGIDDVSISAATLANPLADKPTFSVPSDKYISTQSVELSTATSGATIYYTTNGDDPTISSSVYSSAISVSSTTTIKAIAVAANHANSTIASATYTFPILVANLAALRAADISGFYKVTGECYTTFVTSAGKAKYIQDASAGIIIYDGSGTITSDYAIGDGITGINCTLIVYYGTLELIPFNDPGIATSTGNLITPKLISIADLNTGNYESQLVKISNVSIAETGIFATSTKYTINDDNTSGNLRVAYSDQDYIGKTIPNTVIDITGVVHNYNTTEFDLVPRFTTDFSVGLTTLIETYSVSKIYSSNGNILFTTSAGHSVIICNSLGQQLINTKTVEGLNSIPISAQGIVFIKVNEMVRKIIL